MSQAVSWERTSSEIFWSRIAPTDHVMQIYDNDAMLLNALAGFVGGGINAGDAIIVIATRAHLDALESLVSSCGVHVRSLIANGRYIPLDAKDTLATFMVDGWPDEDRFLDTASAVIKKAGQGGRRIRAFGEMVALLWAEGNVEATAHLEHLWNKLCKRVDLCLFCAYPKSGFTEPIHVSTKHICNEHTYQIKGSGITLRELEFQASGEAKQEDQ